MLKVSILYGNKLIYEEVLHFFFKIYTVFAEKLYAENMSVLRFFDFISDEHISYVIFIYIACHPMFKKLGNEITSICYLAISIIHMLQISVFSALRIVCMDVIVGNTKYTNTDCSEYLTIAC